MNYEAAQDTFRICAQWRKSSYSSVEGQECVEVIIELPGWVGVRDSKLGAESPVLACAAVQWQAMVAGARLGRLGA